MTPPTTSWKGFLPTLVFSTALALVVIGAVMADSHVPVPIAPDAKPADGAQVATFAVG